MGFQYYFRWSPKRRGGRRRILDYWL